MDKLLIVDDDITFLKSIKKLLEGEGFDVTTESNPIKVKDNLKNYDVDAVLIDVKMPGLNGIELMKIIKNEFQELPVIFISGQSSIPIAVEAIKLGAYDFIEKPVDIDRLIILLSNAVQRKQLKSVNKMLSEELAQKYRMIGESENFLKLINEIDMIASSSAKVLITGESGTGKELVAWAIHHKSDRVSKPYIKLNCAAIPSELLESELFGHKKGAFTGAITDKKGKFIEANGGSLFLDEIGDMSLNLQAKLLRVLEENEIEIVGENIPRKVNVRIIAATNQNLMNKIEKNEFRHDLFHRLNVVRIEIPPLRERKADIIPIAKFFLERFNDEYNRGIVGFTPEAQKMLVDCNWVGNVRELRNTIENLVIFSKSNEITLNDVMEIRKKNTFNRIESETFNEDLKLAREEFEKNHIFKMLNKNEWKIGETADLMGIDRTSLFKKMQKYNINR